ncbi:MAG: glycosyltransferase [Bacteroidota bacterium]|jgi:cellulose synthase/poly-beta-1,6-N-acetylglucosamine synthase-like glycosyltransferase
MEYIAWFSLLLLVGYILLIFIYHIGWLLIKPFALPSSLSPKHTFSILIPARNEAAVIEQCLQSIVGNHYPDFLFEVIVIDDYSTDETAQVVQQFIHHYSNFNIRLIQMKDDTQQRKLKKAAITAAIEQATGSYIILTDADCTRGSNWLKTIDAFIQTNEAKMVYAPVAFSAKNIFEKIQSLEFSGLVGIGASAIRLKNPNMCSAANLIFEKNVFNEVNGYVGNDGVASGDDEFLLHKVFKVYPNNVYFLKHKQAIVYTSPNASVTQLTEQRRRWVSKSTKYENRYITAIMVGAYLFNFFILFNLIFNPWIGLTMLAIKTFFEGAFLWSIQRLFNQTHLLLLLPVAEIFHIVYVLVIGIWGNVGTYNWKGRDLK